jgi:hypothetical protein
MTVFLLHCTVEKNFGKGEQLDWPWMWSTDLTIPIFNIEMNKRCCKFSISPSDIVGMYIILPKSPNISIAQAAQMQVEDHLEAWPKWHIDLSIVQNINDDSN